MVTGLADHKEPDQTAKRKKITDRKPFEFARTVVEETKLIPQASQFLKKGDGVGAAQRPWIDGDARSPHIKRPATAINRTSKHEAK